MIDLIQSILITSIIAVLVAGTVLRWISSSLEKTGKAYGFELVSEVSGNPQKTPDLYPRVDIIFVHGLGSQRDRAWSTRNKLRPSTKSRHPESFSWVQDLLPQDLKEFLTAKNRGTVRLYLYGYNSEWSVNAPVATIHSLAEGLLHDLEVLDEENGSKSSRLVFVAHSHGGLVVKEALVIDSFTNGRASIASRTDGVLFFGTPHHGSELSWIAQIVALGLRPWGSESGLLASLHPRSEVLSNLHKYFIKALKMREGPGLEPIAIRSFLEKEKTKVLPFGLDMGWADLVVHELSAELDTTDCDNIELNRDHKRLNKFTSRDADYRKVFHALKSCLKLDREQLSIVRQQKGSENQRMACLRSLAFDKIDARKHDIIDADPRTGEWLSLDAQFQQWLYPSPEDAIKYNGLFCIKGKAGAGKSTLFKYILAHCKRGPLRHCTMAAYFFNARGELLERTILGMFRSLVFQVISADSQALERFLPLYVENQEKFGKDWHWHVGQLKEFLRSEVERVDPMQPLREFAFFIDALDECDENEIRGVVKFFGKLGSVVHDHCRVRFCLTLRRYPVINTGNSLDLILEDVPEHHESITSYVKTELLTEDPTVQCDLNDKANGVFMWVVLAVEILNKLYDEGGTVKDMKEKLEELPPEIDNLYLRLLQPGKESPETILMFQWVLFSQTRLEVSQLYFGVQAGIHPEILKPWNPADIDINTMKRFIQTYSKGLIEITGEEDDRSQRNNTLNTSLPKEQQFFQIGTETGSVENISNFEIDEINLFPPTVQFIHKTVKDFLVENGRFQLLDPALGINAIGQSHDRIVRSYLSYISMVLKFKGPQDWYSDNIHTYPLLSPALSHILYHAEQANQNGVSQLDFLRQLHDQCMWKDIGMMYDIERRILHYKERGLEAKTLDPKSDRSLLYELAKEGYHSLLSILLGLSVDVNAQGGAYGTALQAAVLGKTSGSKTCVEMLLSAGSNVNIQSGYYGNALQVACQGFSPDIPYFTKLLLNSNANVNAKGGHYSYALHAAAFKLRSDSNCIKMLLEAGGDVNAQSALYGTALQAAASNIAPIPDDVLQLLLQQTKNINACGGSYGSALQAAASNHKENFVRLLLERGADVNAHGRYGGSAIQAAFIHTCDSAERVERQRIVAKLLIDAGADLSVVKDPTTKERIRSMGYTI